MSVRELIEYLTREDQNATVEILVGHGPHPDIVGVGSTHGTSGYVTLVPSWEII